MKKLILLFCSLCMILSLSLTACGSTEAKIYGIRAFVGLPEDNGQYGITDSPLADKTTLVENDFVLEIGKTYDLLVDYIAGGGSQYPVLFAENFVLKYAAYIFDIVPVYDENCLGENKPLRYYNLTCKQATSYSTIIIEANEQYTCNVIVSAK